MKFVKLSIFALSMGLFVASCGDSANDESTETVDSTTMMAPEPAAPAPMDTTTAMPADTSAAAATPADTTHH